MGLHARGGGSEGWPCPRGCLGRLGVELDGSQNALIDKNKFESPAYYPPTSPPTPDQANNEGLIKIYENSTATILNNVLRNGSWGVTLDDVRPPGNLLTLPFRSTYALIQDNV